MFRKCTLFASHVVGTLAASLVSGFLLKLAIEQMEIAIQNMKNNDNSFVFNFLAAFYLTGFSASMMFAYLSGRGAVRSAQFKTTPAAEAKQDSEIALAVLNPAASRQAMLTERFLLEGDADSSDELSQVDENSVVVPMETSELKQVEPVQPQHYMTSSKVMGIAAPVSLAWYTLFAVLVTVVAEAKETPISSDEEQTSAIGKMLFGGMASLVSAVAGAAVWAAPARFFSRDQDTYFEKMKTEQNVGVPRLG
jgi:hypothetical protein